jgi:hypothetical protein
VAFSDILRGDANDISDGESAAGNTAAGTHAGIAYAGMKSHHPLEYYSLYFRGE